MLIWTSEELFWVPKPQVVTQQNGSRRRLHNDTGPACANVIENLYFLEGHLVPAHVVLCPELQTITEIDGEENSEIKRIRIERFGWQRYLTETGATVLDFNRNDIDQTDEALMQAPDGARVLVCACPSTARVYSMRVPREIDTCRAAQSWLAGENKIRVISAS